MEVLAPELVRTDLKAEGGAKRLVTYDIFPPSEDILWPNGVGFSAVPASAAFGARLVDLLVERIGGIVDTELGGD
jgi:hypothetical protein